MKFKFSFNILLFSGLLIISCIDKKDNIVMNEPENKNLIEKLFKIPYYNYSIKAPENYMYIIDDNRKAGFYYYIFTNSLNVQNIKDLYDKNLLEKMPIEIYFGFHPEEIDEIYNDYEFVKTIESKLLDQNVKWNIYKNNDIFYTGVIIKISYEYMRILGQGDNIENIMELINICSTIKKID